LRRLGVSTIGDLAAVPVDELVGALGQAHGTGLHRLARAADDRPVVSERESKSVSVEETFPVDVADRSRLRAELDLMTERVARRLAASGYSGRTVTLKARLHDFRTLSRSTTLPGATDDAGVLRRVARGLLAEVDVTSGLRLLGVGVSGLSDQAQAELPDLLPDARAAAADDAAPVEDASDAQPASARRWLPGADVRHETLGPGWVQGSGVGRVTVRFETAATGPGPVRTFAIDDPALAPAEPQPVRVLTESAPEST
jgi:DNA polymerase-4